MNFVVLGAIPENEEGVLYKLYNIDSHEISEATVDEFNNMKKAGCNIRSEWLSLSDMLDFEAKCNLEKWRHSILFENKAVFVGRHEDNYLIYSASKEEVYEIDFEVLIELYIERLVSVPGIGSSSLTDENIVKPKDILMDYEIDRHGYIRITDLKICNTTYIIPSGLKNIYSIDKSSCPIKKIIVPSSIRSLRINSYSWPGVDLSQVLLSLEEVDVHKGLKVIQGYSFESAYELRRVTLPDTLKVIGQRAFKSCNKLESMNIPRETRFIGSEAFDGCTSLKFGLELDKVYFIGNSAFSNCAMLNRVKINVLGKEIHRGTFNSCCELTDVDIEGNVECIGALAFGYCMKLSSIKIPDTVKNIEYHAFYECRGLTSFKFPKSIERIGTQAFFNCPLLRIEMGHEKSEINIDMLAFACCLTLHEVILNGNVKIDRSAFKDSRIGKLIITGTASVVDEDMMPASLIDCIIAEIHVPHEFDIRELGELSTATKIIRHSSDRYEQHDTYRIG